MLRRNKGVRPPNGTLELSPEAFNGVGVALAPSVVVLSMLNASVHVAETASCETSIRLILVAHDVGPRLHVLLDEGEYYFRTAVRHFLNLDAALPLNHAENCALVLELHSILPAFSVVRLVYFDDAGERIPTLFHKGAYLVSHAPCGFVRNAELPLELLGCYAVLRGRE